MNCVSRKTNHIYSKVILTGPAQNIDPFLAQTSIIPYNFSQIFGYKFISLKSSPQILVDDMLRQPFLSAYHFSYQTAGSCSCFTIEAWHRQEAPVFATSRSTRPKSSSRPYGHNTVTTATKIRSVTPTSIANEMSAANRSFSCLGHRILDSTSQKYTFCFPFSPSSLTSKPFKNIAKVHSLPQYLSKFHLLTLFCISRELLLQTRHVRS